MATYFHIGLPKTATSFWQSVVFSRIDDLSLIHRRTGEDDRRFLKRFVNFVHRADRTRGAAVRRILHDYLRERAVGGDILVSNENLSLTGKGFWDASSAPPEWVADEILAAGRATGDAAPKVVIGLRRPEDWIASRYAESSKAFGMFGQTDFETRIGALIERQTLEGMERWLDHRHVVEIFRARFGDANAYFANMEDLSRDPRASILLMGRFLGGRDFTGLVGALESEGRIGRRVNSLSGDDGTWRLRSNDAPLHFPERLREAFRARFAPYEAAEGRA